MQSASIDTEFVHFGNGDDADTRIGLRIVGTLRLRNVGTGPATITGYTINGPRSWYHWTCPAPGGTLAPGASCDIIFYGDSTVHYTYSQSLSFYMSATVTASGIPAASFSGPVSVTVDSGCGGGGGGGDQNDGAE